MRLKVVKTEFFTYLEHEYSSWVATGKPDIRRIVSIEGFVDGAIPYLIAEGQMVVGGLVWTPLNSDPVGFGLLDKTLRKIHRSISESRDRKNDTGQVA